MTAQSTQRIRDSLIGTTLQGEGGTKFHVRNLLGEGGQGWVFQAHYDDPEGFWIVVKILRPEGLSRETLERFERETRVLQMLGTIPAPNPNIVRFYDHGMHRIDIHGARIVVPFIALEYVEGKTLTLVLDEANGKGLPLARTLRMMRQVARALHTVHEHRIVHRDLKPSNILLATQHGQEVAKITDFGLVKAPGLSAKSTATIAGATLGYAPPEQYEMGNSRVGPQTDIFSFATILFECMTGRVAFPHTLGESPLRTVARMLSGDRPQLARHLDTISPELRNRPDTIARLDVELARATAADPLARHPTVEQLWNAIEPILRTSVTGEHDDAATIPQPQQRWASSPENAVAVPPAPLPAVGRFNMIAPAMSRERLRAAAFALEERAVYAIGLNGLYRCHRGSWASLPLPGSIDIRSVRGVAVRREGEVLLFGDSGLALVLDAKGGVRPLAGVDGEFNWLGAFTEDGDWVLAGERRTRAVGVVAEVGNHAAHVHTLQGTTRLHDVTRLASGSLLACGVHGDLVHITPGGGVQVPWGRTGHLLSIARTNNGGAYTVGSGGHALAVTPRTAIGPDASPDLVATLEAVQTTRDIVCVRLEPDGTPWAVGQAARLLRRKSGVWTRIPLEGTSAHLIALHPFDSVVTVLAEDGMLLEGRVE